MSRRQTAIQNLRKGQRVFVDSAVQTVTRDAVTTGQRVFVDTDRGQFSGHWDDLIELF